MIRGQTEADQRNIRAVWIWSFVWAAGFVAAIISLRRLEQLPSLFLWLLALLPTLFSIPLVCALRRFLREADELMRKIQLEGIAIGYSAGSIFCVGYHGLEHVGAPQLPIVFAVVPLGLGWAIGSFLVAYRHR